MIQPWEITFNISEDYNFLAVILPFQWSVLVEGRQQMEIYRRCVVLVSEHKLISILTPFSLKISESKEKENKVTRK